MGFWFLEKMLKNAFPCIEKIDHFFAFKSMDEMPVNKFCWSLDVYSEPAIYHHSCGWKESFLPTPKTSLKFLFQTKIDTNSGKIWFGEIGKELKLGFSNFMCYTYR